MVNMDHIAVAQVKIIPAALVHTLICFFHYLPAVSCYAARSRCDSFPQRDEMVPCAPASSLCPHMWTLFSAVKTIVSQLLVVFAKFGEHVLAMCTIMLEYPASGSYLDLILTSLIWIDVLTLSTSCKRRRKNSTT